MNIEYFDVYDKNRNKTGKIIKRGELLRDNEVTIFVQVWLVNKEGKFLVQKRSIHTSSPGKWCATGGHVKSNETSLECAIRETKEEMGIDLEKLNGGLFDSRFYSQENQNYICDSYLYEFNQGIEECKIDLQEVEEVKFFSMDEIINLMNQKQCFTYWMDYLQILIDKTSKK